MKKLPVCLMMMVLSLSMFPSKSAAAEKTAVTANTAEMPADVKVMFNRLEEIKAMDKSDLSRSEKKELRKEVKAIKAELQTKGHGVYLSVGAVIIIVLLLILMF